MLNLIQLKNTLGLRAFAFLKIPLIYTVKPHVLSMNETGCEIVLPLCFRNKNHLNAMYFGALCIGADCAGGLVAVNYINQVKENVVFLFKDFDARFLKRAEADVHFKSKSGKSAKKAIDQAIKTGQRVNTPLEIIATTPKVTGNEPIAKFKLTLSVKVK